MDDVMTSDSTFNRDELVPNLPVVRITDSLITAIEREIASVPPERGGALLGIGSLAHLLVVDTSAQYTTASWDISAALSETVGAIEAAGHGTLIGTVHSHPSQVADPSGTDITTMTLALEMNAHLDQLLIAIVTAGAPRLHDVAVGASHRMSIHILKRQRGRPELQRAGIEVTSLGADLEDADLLVGSSTSVSEWNSGEKSLPLTLSVNRRNKLLIPTSSPDPQALLLDELYPVVGPLRVSTQVGDDGRFQLTIEPSPWDLSRPSGPQLRRMSQVMAASTEGSLDRVTQLVGSLADTVVAVVGAGSVGSRIAEDLARSGVGSMVLVDPDVVEPANLARSVYTTADVGVPKTTALEERLRLINPSLIVRTHESTISAVDPSDVLDAVHLVVAATDDMEEQAHLSHHAYARSIPLVACAIYRRGSAGEVVMSMPVAGTACWSCAAGIDTASANRRPAANYGLAGRLVGESAIGPAINAVTSVASQVAVGILAGPSTPSGAPIVGLLEQKRTLGVISTTPNWDFFPELFNGMSHQFHPQSVWPVVNQRPDCPACGDHQRPPLSRDEGQQFAEDLAAIVRDEHAEVEPETLQNSKQPTATDDQSRDPRYISRITTFLRRVGSILLRRS